MIIQNFAQLEEQCKSSSEKKKIAVVNASDRASLEAVFHPNLERSLVPLLIGDEKEIKAKLIELKFDKKECEIQNATTDQEAAAKGVELVRKKEAQILIKGRIGTVDFLKAIVTKDTGIKEEGVLTHIALNELPFYPKFLLTSDGGMVASPSLDDKVFIINNAVNVMQKLGYEQPKVAVLAASEFVNNRIQSSIEADLLKLMNIEGKIKNCIIEGPISLDLAVSAEMAAIKGYKSVVAGDADILISPDVTASNILGKSLINLSGGKMAGLVCGAKVPIVLTSRGSSAEEKYLSLLLSFFL